MSGGSFNYLFVKAAWELGEGSAMEDLERMADELAKLGYAADAAAETQTIILDYRAFVNRTQTAVDRLKDTWHSMEWWHSNDGGEDDVKKSLAKYRGETP